MPDIARLIPRRIENNRPSGHIIFGVVEEIEADVGKRELRQAGGW
jgi:hypothetical protein